MNHARRSCAPRSRCAPASMRCARACRAKLQLWPIGPRPDGTLVPRSERDALISDPAMATAQARTLAASVDTIHIHGDSPNALAIARPARDALGFASPDLACVVHLVGSVRAIKTFVFV